MYILQLYSYLSRAKCVCECLQVPLRLSFVDPHDLTCWNAFDLFYMEYSAKSQMYTAMAIWPGACMHALVLCCCVGGFERKRVCSQAIKCNDECFKQLTFCFLACLPASLSHQAIVRSLSWPNGWAGGSARHTFQCNRHRTHIRTYFIAILILLIYSDNV